jgi:hypothetical protein
VRCSDVTANSFITKVMGQKLRTLSRSRHSVTGECAADCLACQDECFVKTPIDVKENDEHSFEFSLDISRLFLSR